MFKNYFKKEFVFCAAIGAGAADPGNWWEYADKQMRGDRTESEMVMTIQTPNWTRTLEILSQVDGKDQALSTIKAPAKEKGIKTLRLESNMWNYFPKLRRKIAVSSSMLLANWMGSDFTNDDILKASSMSKDYNSKFLPDEKLNGETMKVIENLPKDNSKVMWPRIVTLSSKKDCLPRESRYYDKEGTLKRVLSFGEIKTFDGHKVPTIWVMQPQDDKTKKTVLEYKDIDFKVKFKPNHFSQQNLTQD